MLLALGAGALLAWVYLVFFHGLFWRCDQGLPAGAEVAPARWPAVAAVVPARDEAAVLEPCLVSLLEQDYPGSFTITLVDDESRDGTGDVARALAAAHPRGARLTVVATPPRPAGWVGKMWALATGVAVARRAAGAAPAVEYLLLTDADVAHPRDHLRRLVSAAEHEHLDLVSQMVLLESRGTWTALLIPAFVYFFQQLYPFRRVNDPAARTAAAAGGTMLVRAPALERAGGIEAVRAELIDDCALARALKAHGPIWLGLAPAVSGARSVRPYRGLGGVWAMVARSAYTQLRRSPLLLAVTVAALTLVYLVPPALALGLPLHGERVAAALGALAWLLMAATFVPTLLLYRRPLVMAPLVPLAGLLYLAMTVDSAWRHWRGRGGQWKGRVAADGGARTFTHLDPEHPPHGLPAVWRWAIGDRLRGVRRRAPPGPGAPRVSADLEAVSARHDRDGSARLTWIGHASFLIAVGGRRVLIDPVFARRLWPVYPRHVVPGLVPEQLPPIDLLAITHAHYDHLDAPSVRALPRTTPVAVPAGLGRFFRRRGFARVHELVWWQAVTIAGLRVTLVPARHWSRRTPFDLNRSLWGGYVIEVAGARRATAVYHAGDSAWFERFAEIGARFPGLLAALLPIGAYAPAWFMEHSHMNPEQAGRAFLALGARHLIGMHWGSFQLTDEPLAEPAERLRAWWRETAPRGRDLHLPAVGETIVLEDDR